MKGSRIIFFDVGCTLVCEDAVWAARCREQAEGDEAKALGLSADDIYRAIVDASLAHLPQYRTLVKRYGFTAPAKTIGMQTIWIRQGFGGMQSPRGTGEQPDAAVDGLGELLGLLI